MNTETIQYISIYNGKYEVSSEGKYIQMLVNEND